MTISKEGLIDNQSDKERYNQHLFREQSKVQKGKEHERTLYDYNELIFISEVSCSKISFPTQEFFDQYCGPGVNGIEKLLDRIVLLRDRPINWVDMGGGRGLAMRQIGKSTETGKKVNMINVDLFDYDLQELHATEKEYLERKYPGIFNHENKPELIKTNSEVVNLPQKADLITSIESIQYLNNPLAAICNWYNQLTDHGLLIIARELQWTGFIRFENHDPKPFDLFLNTLQDNKIAYYAHQRYKNEHDLIMIEKKPNTSMLQQTSIKEIWTNPDGYKAVYYGEEKVPVEIQNTDNQNIQNNLDYKEINKLIKIP